MKFNSYLNRVRSLINKIRSREETNEERREFRTVFAIDAVIFLLLVLYLIGKYMLRE